MKSASFSGSGAQTPVPAPAMPPLAADESSPLKLVRRWSRQRFAVPMIIASAALALLVNEVSYKSTVDALRVGASITDARLAAANVLQLLTDAETGQRGYLLTGREDFLAPLEAAKREVPRMRVTVAGFLEASGPEGHAEALRMDEDIREALTEIEKTVALERAGEHLAALHIVSAGLGRHRMDQMRVMFGTSLVAAAQRQRVSGVSIDDSLWSNRVAVAILTLLGAIALSFYVRHLRLFDIEREARQLDLEGQVRERTGELRAMAGHLVTAREDEKAHLARELHDELGSLMTAAKLDVARMRSKLAGEPALLERLDQISHRLNEGIAFKRRIVEDLRPSSLDNMGLTVSLKNLCSDVAGQLAIPVVTAFDEVTLTEDQKLAVYRLVQEALTNVSKYAKATRVLVSVQRESAAVHVRIEDDGVGFDQANIKSATHGIAGMRLRIDTLGGTMRVDSQPGLGARLEATLPVPGAAPAPPQ